jgi:hypothetical protein
MSNAISEYPKPPLPHVPQPLEPRGPLAQPRTVIVYEREQWEYTVLEKDSSSDQTVSESELNELGRAGWELAGVVAAGARAQLIFKRLQR